jgi:hypothetical protein
VVDRRGRRRFVDHQQLAKRLGLSSGMRPRGAGRGWPQRADLRGPEARQTLSPEERGNMTRLQESRSWPASGGSGWQCYTWQS